jgi:hypothetical protein
MAKRGSEKNKFGLAPCTKIALQIRIPNLNPNPGIIFRRPKQCCGSRIILEPESLLTVFGIKCLNSLSIDSNLVLSLLIWEKKNFQFVKFITTFRLCYLCLTGGIIYVKSWWIVFSGSGIWNPRGRMEKTGPGINIPDPQHRNRVDFLWRNTLLIKLSWRNFKFQ